MSHGPACLSDRETGRLCSRDEAWDRPASDQADSYNPPTSRSSFTCSPTCTTRTPS